MRWPLAQHIQHGLQIEPAIADRIRDLIEHDQEVLTGHDGGCSTLPAFSGQLRRVRQILALPAEAVAQSLNRHADLLEHAVLAKARRRHLHELVDLDGLAASVCAHGQAKGCRALAFAIAGVDEDESATLALRLLGLAVDGGLFNVHLRPFRGETMRPWPLDWMRSTNA
jgi:hypothetical protein